MLTCEARDAWTEFLICIKKRCSSTAFHNWLEPIRLIQATTQEVVLEVPNVFVQDYLLTNFQEELRSFLPVDVTGQPAIRFVIAKREKTAVTPAPAKSPTPSTGTAEPTQHILRLNSGYRFENYIEGPHNQFVKSAAIGVASHPGKSYNPLFIHGGVGLGKTHILHSIGHAVRENHPRLRIQCITTEAFVNDLVDCLRNKSLDQMKRFYRSNVDLLLVDDIQFLQNRLNFEEEFCNMFETLINQGKQIVITSDKPPAQLQLSERMTARMEWGLVAHLDIPDLETRVAILQHKAQLRGLDIPHAIAFYIAEHIANNVRQLEGAVNRLSAQCRLLDRQVTEQLVKESLKEMLQNSPRHKISVEQILKSVAAVFQVRVSDLKGNTRTKEIALPRQVAMYLAKEMITESLIMLGASFGKTHSTVLHAHKSIEKRASTDETLRRQIGMVRRNLSAA